MRFNLPLRTGSGMFSSSKNLPTRRGKIVIAIGVLFFDLSQGPEVGGRHGRVRWEVWYRRA